MDATAAGPAAGRRRRVLAIHGGDGDEDPGVFPFQLLGFAVDSICTVQQAGGTLSGEELTALVDGLDADGRLGAYTHVLSGWVGEVVLCRAVAAAVRRVRQANPSVVYVCDPVLGDNVSKYGELSIKNEECVSKMMKFAGPAL